MLKAREFVKVITAKQQREGGGFVVRRPVGGSEIPTSGPFLMLDHFGPVKYGPGEAVGAPDHPHRGFETVSYIKKGGIHHQDSHGNEGFLRDGWVQWMTAGSGVIHSEMPVPELLEKGGEMEGFQLWVNLPRKFKMIDPRYQDVPPEEIPEYSKNGLKVKVIAGEFEQVKATIDTKTEIMFFDVEISPNSRFEYKLPKSYEGFIYLYKNQGKVCGERMIMGQAGELEKKTNENEEVDETIVAENDGDEPFAFLLIAGVPINEPISRYGPFVMNTQEEIIQAFQDYQTGNLAPKIAGQEERYKATEQARQKQQQSGFFQQQQKDLNN